MMALHTKRRWSDKNFNFGPFTFSRDCGGSFSIVLDSGHGESPGCHLRILLLGFALLIDLPPMIRPWRNWVDTSLHEWGRANGGGYWDEHANEYGFSLNKDGFFTAYLGPQTHESDTTKSWSHWLGFCQWRFHRFSLYDLEGAHFWSQIEQRGMRGYDKRRQAEEQCPVARFEFDDFDGNRIIATTQIHEYAWLYGDGWFKWLSWFRRPMVRRSLDLRFSEEVGPEKGSWKGGTIGHSIEMLPGELHEAAFRRYCEQDHSHRRQEYRLKFVGLV